MMPEKRKYRIENWSAYNAALVQRGSITLWLEESAVQRWYGNERAGKPGAPTRYSDWMIQTVLVIRSVFGLPLRALEGFVGSVVRLMGLEGLSVPDYSTFCRRQQRNRPFRTVIAATRGIGFVFSWRLWGMEFRYRAAWPARGGGEKRSSVVRGR